MSRAHRGLAENYPGPVAPANPDVQERARHYLKRTNNTDLLEILGLADPEPTAPGTCGHCGEPLPMSQAAGRTANRWRGYCNPTCAGAAGAAKSKTVTSSEGV
jgi:hypothetical protein